jgi:hypothetical protein
MDLNQVVIMPTETYQELSEAAWNSPPTTLGGAVISSMQTIIVCTAFVGAITGASYGWAKAMDWLERQQLDRKKTTNRTSTTSTP